jgi:hypothetical protein
MNEEIKYPLDLRERGRPLLHMPNEGVTIEKNPPAFNSQRIKGMQARIGFI